ncbi:MAG: DNA-packaging protein [Alphaproteobacteria bacterium]|nr:DNA-packaging protein [Alphaproteobacteria bacterium]
MIGCAEGGLLPAFLARLDHRELMFLRHDWRLWAHAHQLAPAGDWRCWLLMGGRGAGKTRAGAEWLRACVRAAALRPDSDGFRIALVGGTQSDAREVMVEGSPACSRSIRRASARPGNPPGAGWNGRTARWRRSFPPRTRTLRGPQFHLAWCDELAKWRHVQETWDMLQFALRLGERPRQLVTTTPRPIPLLKRLMADPATVAVTAPTESNAAHLAAGFVAAIRARYGGTRLARQELDRGDGGKPRRRHVEPRRAGGAADRPGAGAGTHRRRGRSAGKLWRRLGCLRHRRGQDRCGQDRSCARRPEPGAAAPARWASAAVALWRDLEADCLVAEVNQGGEMVAAVIAGVDPGVPVRAVRARRGKWLRAEPVAMLYEQGRVRHVGAFPIWKTR